MKMIRNKSKKGFTLVELIVVLVILAVLAAMLVPALTGYIRRARQEKDYQFAATVLTAAQSAATYQYSLPADKRDGTITQSAKAGGQNSETVATLVGDSHFTCSFEVNNGIIGNGTVTVNNATYSWNSETATWTATSDS